MSKPSDKERPILFSGEMVRAILAGRKTQTRRFFTDAVLPESLKVYQMDEMQFIHGMVHGRKAGEEFQPMVVGKGPRDMGNPVRCPYGALGARLWVRENGWERPDRTQRMLFEGADTWAPYYYDADGYTDVDGEQFKAWGFKRRPSIFMPRWASRITLEVTGVRVERLQDISEVDAQAEGIRRIGDQFKDFPNDGPNKFTVDLGIMSWNQPTAKPCYQVLWDHINGEGAWDANPWVWVVEFKPVTSEAAVKGTLVPEGTRVTASP